MIGRVNTGGGTGATLTVTALASPNLITFPSDSIPNGATISGITFTAVDGYYEFNGTATNDLWLRIHSIGTDAPFDLNAKYSLSGAPEGSSRDTLLLAATDGLGSWRYDDGAGVTFQFSEIKEGPARVEIQIIKGATLDHVVVRPQFVKRNATVVTVSKDGKTKTKTAGADGVAVFKGLSTGEWTLSITDGTQAAQKTVTITADYSTSITFFSATIHVTYPAGSTCTATDGVTTLTAPNTSGTWACVVPNAGTWTIHLSSGFCEVVSVNESGRTFTVDRWHLYNAGDERTNITGGWTSIGKKASAEAHASAEAPTITRNSANIKANIPTKNRSGIFYTANKVDLKGFSKLTVNGDVYNASQDGVDMALKIWSSLGTYYRDNTVASANFASKVHEYAKELDVSKLTGSYFIGFVINTYYDTSSYVIISECYLSC